MHVGNAVNFLLAGKVAAERGADLLLRIDDLDAPRMRREYLEDIFRVLDWLGVQWQIGPQSASEVVEWSQHRRVELYRQARETLLELPDAFYVCACSRSMMGDPERACSCHGLELVQGETCLRMQTDGDDRPVIWRRNGLPAYHLASIVDDDFFDVTLIVRGEDLRPASDLQRQLAGFLPGNTFPEATLVHHGLVTDDRGVKLSKSAGSGAQPLHLTSALLADIEQRTERLRAEVSPAD